MMQKLSTNLFESFSKHFKLLISMVAVRYNGRLCAPNGNQMVMSRA